MTDYLLLKTNGIPAGGNAGQVLQKQSNQDYDVDWVDNDSTGFLKFRKIDSGTYTPVSGDTAGALDPYFVSADGSDLPPDTGVTSDFVLVYDGTSMVQVLGATGGGWTMPLGGFTKEDGYLFHETYDGKEKYFIDNSVKTLDFNLPANVVISQDDTVDTIIVESSQAAALATSTANPKAIVFYPI